MNRAERIKLNRELYRYEGATTTTRMDDGRFWVRVMIKLFPDENGQGVASDHHSAQALAWRNLKRKVFIV